MIGNPSSAGSVGQIFKPFSQCTNQSITLAAKVAIAILKANEKRAYAAIINNSDIEVTLVLDETGNAALNKGIILKPHGGSFEICCINLYVGAISAVAEKACSLSFVECVS